METGTHIYCVKRKLSYLRSQSQVKSGYANSLVPIMLIIIIATRVFYVSGNELLMVYAYLYAIYFIFFLHLCMYVAGIYCLFCVQGYIREANGALLFVNLEHFNNKSNRQDEIKNLKDSAEDIKDIHKKKIPCLLVGSKVNVITCSYMLADRLCVCSVQRFLSYIHAIILFWL